MATLAVNALRDYQLGDNEEYPVIADDIIYQGAAVGENASGYSRPLQAGDPFQGFAEAMADNAGGAAGAVNVNVKARGRVVLAISAIGITANDRPVVYASDDNTFTLTASTNSPIGRVSRWVSTGVAVVEFDASMAAEIVARAAGDV
ncbi:cytoplasmic protein [Roseibium aggregatum]|nr:cytoplasmic protein [Roseibium aggregatum]